MTPKEKAVELVWLFYTRHLMQWVNYADAKECAIFVADEFLDYDMMDMSEEYFEKHIEFWEQVKQEIINL
jgi:hypothetical protein